LANGSNLIRIGSLLFGERTQASSWNNISKMLKLTFQLCKCVLGML
jgi:hypothetical protein